LVAAPRHLDADQAIFTVVVTIRDRPQAPWRALAPAMHKTLGECDSVKFEENSSRIRIDFAQKHRFNANNSFKAVC